MHSNSSSPEIFAAITDTSLLEADLNNCDRELIHIPNLIQPHGVLIAISAAEYKILQVSLNTYDMLGIKTQEIINHPLSSKKNEEKNIAIKK
ncbi:MAG: cyanobacterial phytochrome A, partial [Pleurocapsa sp.]